MSEHHDPLSDPLPPYWREKVEAAFRGGGSRARRSYVQRFVTPFQRGILDEIEAGRTVEEIAVGRGIARNTVAIAVGRALACIARGGGA